MFRRRHDDREHRDVNGPRHHMWTASASEVDVARQSRQAHNTGGWNMHVGSMMHPNHGPYGTQYGPSSNDMNRNGIPDHLERRSFNDRNGNGIPDHLERRSFNDRNGNGIPDNMERRSFNDRNGNGIPDNLERRSFNDRNGNGIPDNLERRSFNDRNGNGIPDHLEGGVMSQPWHRTGNNSWARSSSATYVDTTAPVYPASTRSDWDHYAINHEKALLGDPVPYRDDALNHPYLANNYTDNAVYGRNGTRKPKTIGQTGPVHTGVAPGYYTGNGPVVAESALDARGRPLKGNYSSGTIIEDGYHPGLATTGVYGRDLDHDGIPDHLEGRGFGGRSRSFGASPLYGTQASGWGSGPIYRDVRDTQTPLLPDNPWTHNELGQDYLDGRGNAPTRKDRHAPNGNVHPAYGNGNLYPNSSYNRNQHF